jgi:integrase
MYAEGGNKKVSRTPLEEGKETTAETNIDYGKKGALSMGLYKRPNQNGPATWCIQYFAHGKRIREAIGPSKREAENVLAKRKVAIREGRFFDVRKESNLAFGVLCDRYLKEYAAIHKKPRSHERNIASTKVLKMFFGENTLAKNIQPEDVHKFIAHRREQGRAAATINGEAAHLSHMFTWANRLKLVNHHPVKGIGFLKANMKDRDLTKEESQCVLAACSGDIKNMSLLALGTGMRASEILSLDRDRTDLKNAVVTLVDTKNGDRRTIPLPPEIVTMLKNRPIPLHEWFPGWTLSRLMKAFRRAVKRAGLVGTGITFHTLRHTFASHAVMSGIDLWTVAKLLGHKNIRQTQRYAHLAPLHLQQAAYQATRALFAADMPHQVPHEKKGVA